MNNVFYTHSSRSPPRSAIYCSSDLHMWKVDEYSDRDVTTCLWQTGAPDQPEVYVCSAYLDGKAKEMPEVLESLLLFCNTNNKELLLSMDTNAHSSLWGYDESDTRGEMVENFLFNHTLTVCNIGDSPTFFNRRCDSIIDVTAATPWMANQLKHWKVNPDFQFSDHHQIEYQLTISENNYFYCRNLNKGAWNIFQELMDNTMANWEEPLYWNRTILDRQVELLNADIKDALQIACPLRQVKGHARPLTWWSKNLTNLRQKVRESYRRLRFSALDEDWEDFKTSQKEFKMPYESPNDNHGIISAKTRPTLPKWQSW